MRRADGSLIWISLTLNAVRDTSGKVVESRTTIVDITGKKRIQDELLKKNEELEASYEELTSTEKELQANYADLARRENELRTSEERFRLLVEYAPDAIFIQINGRFAYLNPAAEALFGVKPGDPLIGTNIIERVQPDYRDQVDQRIQMLNLDKNPVSLNDETYIRMDGTPVEVEVSAVPVVYEGKDGAVVFMRDVTERKRAEHALQRSETQYRTLFGQMLEGFAYCRMVYGTGGRPVDWVYLDTNPAFGRLTGLHDIIGKLATEAIPGIQEMHPELFETYARVARTGEPETIEIHFKPLDIWLNMSLFSPEKDHFVAVFENISERKKTEEALKSSEELYRLLADNAGDVIWILDLLTGRFTYVSPSVERLRGYTPDEVLLQPFGKVITPESYRMIADALPERLTAYQSGDDSVRVQVSQVDQLHKDGSIIPTEVVTTLLPGADRQVTRILGVSRDLRERMRYEEALIDSEKRLRRAELLGKLGHWEVHIDTGMVVGSEGAREIYGLRQPEITFEDIKNVPLPDYRSLLDQAFIDLVKGIKPYNLEFKIRNSVDGSIRTIHSVAEYDPAKQVVFGTIQDITVQDDEKLFSQGTSSYSGTWSKISMTWYSVSTWTGLSRM